MQEVHQLSLTKKLTNVNKLFKVYFSTAAMWVSQVSNTRTLVFVQDDGYGGLMANTTLQIGSDHLSLRVLPHHGLSAIIHLEH